MRTLVIATLLLWPSEAFLSGSSNVHSDSKYFRVEMESVRKIFPRDSGDAEGDWHAEWKKEHQPEVHRIKKKIEADIESLAQTYSLLPWKPDLPEVIEDAEETDEGIEAVKSKKPFHYRLRFEMTSVIVVFAKLPAKSVRRELHKALAKFMPKE